MGFNSGFKGLIYNDFPQKSNCVYVFTSHSCMTKREDKERWQAKLEAKEQNIFGYVVCNH